MTKRIAMFAIGCFGFAASAQAAAPGWTISEATSGVVVTHAGVSRVAARNGQLTMGDIVTTGPNARVVLVRGEEYAMVAPNSRLQVADPEPSGGFTQFVERLGNVVYSIKKKATPHFGVATPYLAAVVKGTTFSVTVDPTGRRSCASMDPPPPSGMRRTAIR